MGKDDQGNAVVLHAQTGEVRSTASSTPGIR